MLKALEQDDYWAVTKALIDAEPGDIASLARALTSFGLVDLARLARSTRARLDSLASMKLLIADDATVEASMHEVIERNLWVLGSEFALVSSNEALQTIIPKALSARFSRQKDTKKRPDLLLLNRYKDRHLLIEFKRPSATVNWPDKAQAEDYRGLLLSYASPIDIIVINGVMTVIADWPHLPRQVEVQKEIDAARDDYTMFALDPDLHLKGGWERGWERWLAPADRTRSSLSRRTAGTGTKRQR